MAARKKLPTTAELIVAHEAELAGLEATIAEAESAIETAYRRMGLGDGENQFLRGRPGYEARERKRKAVERRDDLQRVLPLLAERRAVEVAAEQAKELEQRTAEAGPLVERVADAYRQAGDLFGQLVGGPWRELVAATAAYAAHRAAVEDGCLLVDVGPHDPAAVERWHAATRFP